MTEQAIDPDVPDDVIMTLGDYLDGQLVGDAKKDVEHKIANDPTWKSAHAEMVEAREATSTLSGLQKARAPATFAEDVTATIAKRSAGRFFGKRSFGDKVPFLAILVVAVLGLAAIGYIMYTSQTGSLKVDKTHETQGSSAPVIEKP